MHEWVTHINNYRCDKCDFTAEDAATIGTHVKASHHFICEKCQYEVNNMKDMDVHKKTHDSFTFKCNICGFLGKSLENLKDHT